MQRIHFKFTKSMVMCLPFYFVLLGCEIGERLKKDGAKLNSASTIVALDPGDPLITAADLEPTPGFTQSSLTADEVIENLNQEGSLYANQPDLLTDSACGKLFDALVIKANAKSVLLNTTIDSTACSNQDKKNDTFRFTQMTRKMLLYVSCSSGDLSSMDGKTLSSPEVINLLKLCKNGVMRSEIKTNGKRTSIEPENSYNIEETHTIYMGDQNLKGCKFNVSKNIVTYPEGCIAVEKSDYIVKRSDGVQKVADFAKYTNNGVKSDATSTTDVWYRSGTIDVTVNDWKGTLTYTGSANPPSYVLTQGDGSTAITGKLTATAALHLTDSTPQKHFDLRRSLASIFGISLGANVAQISE